jgi:hypothetical protein
MILESAPFVLWSEPISYKKQIDFLALIVFSITDLSLLLERVTRTGGISV